ncbi:DUF5683 domain-containing protein [Proteinivorax hydrogeniformans]|uniref:DUF5683 domain-containing protein n=1 Tax=Proteinivorax hydrogeniformans TaxID=1826727 RepID=A0AAU8HU72_9FIRM
MIKQKEFPDTSPSLAFMMSLFLPTSGQFYNKQYFKGIIAIAVLLLAINYNHNSWLIYIIYLTLALDSFLTSRRFRTLNKEILFVYISEKDRK